MNYKNGEFVVKKQKKLRTWARTCLVKLDPWKKETASAPLILPSPSKSALLKYASNWSIGFCPAISFLSHYDSSPTLFQFKSPHRSQPPNQNQNFRNSINKSETTPKSNGEKTEWVHGKKILGGSCPWDRGIGWVCEREREGEGERKASVLVKLEWNFGRFEAWKRMKSERQPSGFLAKCA